MSFYGEIFGWKFVKQDWAPIEYYSIEGAGPFGGMLKRPAPVVTGGTNAYVCSIEVKDFDDTQKRILEKGGEMALEKFLVPGKCWQGYFLDGEGNTFGIFHVI